ncbi:MAG: GAF domain-containing protein [Leptolyngbya foveolarum]|uniref:histidine kinase n=1 Tax=Leptolyngbya foveolarum TaxID=47253 RepID=A0A2W4TYF4_9CYAN|nr:MAG: GAF domain-containing protein [Leptolyngbya foveolarum]
MDQLQTTQPISIQENLLHRIANRIRQSLELTEILNTTVTEIRDYLGTDRVKVYKFNSDGNGVVIAESLDHHRLPSLLGLNFPADDIPPYARELFLKARQRSVVDVSSHSIGLSPLDHPETGEAQTDQDIRYRPLDPCHAEYLNAMGVQSSIVVPIVLEEMSTGKEQPAHLGTSDKLWGLIVCHHSESRAVSETELAFIQTVVDQVGLAIAQSVLLNQVRAQAEQEANINRVTKLLYNSPTTELQSALEEAVSTFQGSGGRLYLLAEEPQAKELYACGQQPATIDADQNRTIEENYLWKNFIHSVIESDSDNSGYKPWSVQWMRSAYSLGAEQLTTDRYPNLWAIADLYREPLFRTLAPFFDNTSIRSLLIVPLHHGTHVVGCLTIFRDEIDTEISWAGYHNPDARQLMARQSFEVWKQTKKGEGQAWMEEEIRYAQALSERFSTAIKQYRLYQQVQGLNANLEAQVEERTQQLQQRTQQLQHSNQELENSFSRQEALVGIVSKIRESLDIEEIFRVTTQELSQIMTVDRASVYRFDADWGGEIVADFNWVTPEWRDTGSLGVGTVWNDTHLQETQGGRYRNGEVFVVDDVYQQGLSQCHLDIYEQFKIKAFITVPILVGQELWGILGVYQHQETRKWERPEVEFTNQIAAQLGVALQHASLLAHNRSKTEALSNTLNNLKETQAQLIQTEKMSSLGQLVAGIAHEINNPVNFIHANLAHLNEYTGNLFRVLASYQSHYPDPTDDIEALLEEVDLEYIEQDLPKLCSSLSVGTKRIREIVTSLRNFSRLDESSVKTVDLHEGIESTLLILQHRLKTSDSKTTVKVVKDYGDLPLVECHSGQINQVFMNLIANAIDVLLSMEPADDNDKTKTITITTQQTSPDWVKVSVKDDGEGIEPNVLKKLFDPFFTTKMVGKGTGLGLSISYRIIKEHEGKLYCNSTPGEGAEFVIELPVKGALGIGSLAKSGDR